MKVERIGVAGAGTMGAGIAQLACLGGYVAHLHDPDREALAEGEARIRGDLVRGADRERWTRADAEGASARLRAAPALEDLAACELVIEAAPEDLELKRKLFGRLARICGPQALLATNTSSLSVSAIATGVERPERVLGMHFFNPPALMRLVEVVAGEATSDAAIETVSEVARRMGRTPVRAADAIGFIANRCNRPFTLEALRMLNEGIAGHEEIDRAVRERGGYRMGPFELMDLIGIDVNLRVAQSFFDQRPEARWRPHPIQERMVAEGRLGRKTGHGFYRYPRSAQHEHRPASAPSAAASAQLAVLAGGDWIDDVDGLVVGRIVGQLVNEACFALSEGVAKADDIDTAMRLGLNHPRGPFEWGREIGPERVLALLDALSGELGSDCHIAAPSLRRWAADGSPPA